MGGGTDLLVLGLAATIWWLPALLIARDMDAIPGLPRAFFWLLLPLVGLPIIGPAVYYLGLKRRLIAIGERAAAARAAREQARRARGATTFEDAKRGGRKRGGGR